MDTRLTTEGPAIQVCLAARDLSAFSLLVEDLHAELHEGWGELTLHETLNYLDHADTSKMKVLIVAVDEEDRGDIAIVENIISKSRRIGLATLLVAEDLTDLEIYQLTQCGATQHIEYPLQEGDLAIAMALVAPDLKAPLVHRVQKGSVYAVQGISGGAGSSTLSINLARELSALGTGSVCLIDLDVQFGSIGVELGLPTNDAALDLLFDAEVIDPDWFGQSMQSFGENMAVLTAPSDVLPLDAIQPQGLERLLAMAQTQFDFVVVDMPKTFSAWTQVIFDWADTVFCPVTANAKSPAIVQRFRETCLGDGLDLDNIRFVLNRCAAQPDIVERQLEQLSKAAGTEVELVLPDGGAELITLATATPMSATDPRNVLGQEINKLAQMLSNSRAVAA